MYIGQTLCSGDLRLLMMGYGPRWRTYRKMVHGLLNIQAAKSCSLPSTGEQANAVSTSASTERLPQAHPTLLQCVDDYYGFWMANTDIRRSKDDAALRRIR